MFELLGWVLSGDFGIIELLFLSCGVLLRYSWSNCSDSCVSGWSVFGCFSFCVFKLLFGLLFSKLKLVKLHKLLIRNISFIIRSIVVDKLFELCDGILSIDCWLLRLYCLYRGVVLWYHRADCSDGCLSCRTIFTCHIERMHELFCRILFNQH